MTNIIQPSRRGFITGLTSLIVAPAIVRVENIMPVKAIKFNGLLTIEEITREALDMFCHTSDALLYGHQCFQIKPDEIKIIPLTEIYEIKI